MFAERRGLVGRTAIVVAMVSMVAGCASPPPAPLAGLAQVWGEVAAAPPAGARSEGGLVTYDGGGASSGKELPTGTTLVDYADPGAVVVELVGSAPIPGGALELVATADQIAPAFAAVGANGTVTIANRTSGALTFTLVRDGALVGEVAVAAGASSPAQPMGGAAGVVEVACYERDEPTYSARVVAAVGPYAVRAAGSARYVLDGVPPGRYELVARHARFPEVRRAVELVAGQQLRVDVELGTGGLPKVPAGR